MLRRDFFKFLGFGAIAASVVIPAIAEAVPEGHIRISDILPDGEFVPNVYSYEDVVLLADSIKEMGLMTPVGVWKEGDKYRVIDGRRRVLAYKHLGHTTIPAHIKKPFTINQLYSPTITPIRVVAGPSGGEYYLVDGQARYAAAMAMGLDPNIEIVPKYRVLGKMPLRKMRRLA